MAGKSAGLPPDQLVFRRDLLRLKGTYLSAVVLALLCTAAFVTHAFPGYVVVLCLLLISNQIRAQRNLFLMITGDWVILSRTLRKKDEVLRTRFRSIHLYSHRIFFCEAAGKVVLEAPVRWTRAQLTQVAGELQIELWDHRGWCGLVNREPGHLISVPDWNAVAGDLLTVQPGPGSATPSETISSSQEIGSSRIGRTELSVIAWLRTVLAIPVSAGRVLLLRRCLSRQVDVYVFAVMLAIVTGFAISGAPMSGRFLGTVGLYVLLVGLEVTGQLTVYIIVTRDQVIMRSLRLREQAHRWDVREIRMYSTGIRLSDVGGTAVLRGSRYWSKAQMIRLAKELDVPFYDHRKWWCMADRDEGRLVWEPSYVVP